MAIKFTTETVTPETASRWLATQKKNRKPVMSHVDRLVGFARRNEWVIAQPIAFDESGTLIDGQHRLLAVVKLGKPLTFTIGRGYGPDAWRVFDTGRVRKGNDVLSAEGAASTNLLSASLRLIYQYEMGVLCSRNPEDAPSNGDLLDRYEEHPEVADVIRAVSTNKYARNASIVFLYWATFRLNRNVAGAFWSAVLTGEDMRRDTPPFLLHNLLIDQRIGGRRLEGVEILARAIKAWNAALSGVPLRQLSWRGGVEDFPEICSTRTEAERVASKARRAAS